MQPASAPLQGVGVLVTRPAHQADSLCELIRQQGGTAIRFPVLEIRPPADPQKLLQVIDTIEDYDWAVFISANAVDRTLGIIQGKRDWPKSVRIAVVGKRSAEELERFGLTADLSPQQKFNSEALLALADLQDVGGQRIVIFRGNGGREILANTLRKRGATVEHVEAYRRVRPHSDNAELLRRWRQGLVNIVLVNSAESLRNLVEMLGKSGESLLTATPLLVVSERMLALAEELDFQFPPIVAENATDQAVVDALLAWRRRQSGSLP
jgi:uroporphyrinogen-III synthase